MSTSATDHLNMRVVREPHYGPTTPGKLGIWAFLLSDAFSFFGLLLTYGVFYIQTPEWIPDYLPKLGIPFTAVMTFVLICSSVSMVLAHDACVHKNHAKTVRWLGLTILGGLFFLGGQVYEYTHLIGEGLIFGNSLVGESRYASTFYLITSFHGAHVLTGVIYLIVIFINLIKGKYKDGNHTAIEQVGLFWHFVDLVWILVFAFVYLIPATI